MESKFLIALSMFVLIIRLSAQPYPVDAFVRMHPPFSPYLEDWSSAPIAPISIQLLLQDASERQYPVQLRMSLLGQGIRVTSRTGILQAPILLDYGVPLEVSGSDLALYLDWNNLQVEGIEQSILYQNGGRLPEGTYNFCIEVLDAQRPNEAPLSNQACMVIQLEMLPPPQIIFPADQSQVTELPINFQWIPQHVGNFSTQYTFSLYEKRSGLTDLQILNSTAPLYTTNTQNVPYLLYDWDDPPLESGMSYLVLIEVQDLLEQHHFQEEGRSQVHTFYYGEALDSTCKLSSPSSQVHVQDSQRFYASWSRVADSEGYEIQLATDSSFIENRSIYHTHSVTDTFVNFSGLLSRTPYYLRIRATAGECFSPFDYVGPVTLNSRCQFQNNLEIVAYSCGREDQELAVNPTPPFPHLQVGDSIWANHFPVVLTEVYGTGPFSGRAIGKLAYLQQAQVNFQLQNVEIDESCRLINGQLVLTGGGIKLLEPNDLALLNEILDNLDVIEDWLALSEESLYAIDQFIADLENYLPQEILDNLIQAQQAVQVAQQSYNAALDSGNSEEIEATKEALDAAAANLKKALEAYKEALLLFLRTWLEVAVEVFADLLQDCVWDQLKTSYLAAENTLRGFITTDTEVALNRLPAFAGSFLGLNNESEQIIIESIELTEPETFDQLSSQFYQREMDYLLCHTMKRLETEIQSPEAIASFQQVLEEINANSLARIGEAISLGVPTGEIVQQVKSLIFQDLLELVKRSTYPSVISISMQ